MYRSKARPKEATFLGAGNPKPQPSNSSNFRSSKATVHLPTPSVLTMRPASRLLGAAGSKGGRGVQFASIKPRMESYRSPYGPKYTIQRNIKGINLNRALKFATTASLFGVFGGVFVLQFFNEVPKVRDDIMQKIPIVGDYFVREIPPEDNPF